MTSRPLPLRLPYRPQKPYVPSIMTMAAGIRCSDGLVVCADTEVTEGVTKSDRTKIWKERDFLIVTGSGTSDYIKMAFDKLAAASRVNLPNDSDTAREAVETLIHSIYEDHIGGFRTMVITDSDGCYGKPESNGGFHFLC
jgi:hypothetical protein